MRSKNNSKKKIDKNFSEIIFFLNKKKIKYWLCHGTLLGIIRDRNILSWDNDIDIAIINNEFNKKTIEKYLLKKKYKKKNKFFLTDNLLTMKKYGSKEIDINLYNFTKDNKNVYTLWYIPKNALMKFIDAISRAKKYSGKYSLIVNNLAFLSPLFLRIKKFLINNNFFFNKAGYWHSAKYINKIKKINFFHLKINIPFYYSEYLRSLYGPEWHKTKKDFNWIKDSPATRFFK
jgi:hypothetical protein